MQGIEDHNFPAFRAAAESLVAAGYSVEDPGAKGVIAGWEWADYLRYDLVKLVECDGVATLPGWKDSKGASLEVHVARELGMPVGAVWAWLEKED